MQTYIDSISFKELSLKDMPKGLQQLPNPPQKLYYCGSCEALNNLLESNLAVSTTHKATQTITSKPISQIAPKIAIVGSRKPNPYTKSFVATLATRIAKHSGIVVSGGALGVDIIAHTYAFPRTIMFSPAGLDIIYPKSNAKMIKQMMEQALVMSEYDNGYMPHQYSFLDRNRLVIGLSDYVVIPQADMMSGSMQSARIAMKLNKPLFVLPHRIGESEGTNHLLAQGKAQGIYNIDDFIESIFGASVSRCDDEVLLFCANNPSVEEAFARFGEKIYEYELEGKIMRESGTIRVP